MTLTCTSYNCTNNAVHLSEQRGSQGESAPGPDCFPDKKRRHHLNSRDRNANSRSGGRTCISAIATGECATCMHTNQPVGVREAASFCDSLLSCHDSSCALATQGLCCCTLEPLKLILSSGSCFSLASCISCENSVRFIFQIDCSTICGRE